MGGQSRTVEEIIAAIATVAHGIVTRAELRAEDVTDRQIDRRIEKGLLIAEYRAVYRAGHAARSRESDYTAAVKAGGEGAVLFDHAAGHLLGIIKGQSWPPPAVITRTERRVKGLRTRHSRNLDPRDITEVDGIPVTTVPVTLIHLAATLSDDELAHACHMAHVIYRVGPREINRALKRHPRAKGAGRLKAILNDDAAVLLGYLEKGFFAILKEENLPLPATNKRTDGRYVDCRWQKPPVTVELQGFRFHNSRWAFDDAGDRERDAYARGEQFRRYTYKDVFEKPDRMLAELRELLA